MKPLPLIVLTALFLSSCKEGPSSGISLIDRVKSMMGFKSRQASEDPNTHSPQGEDNANTPHSSAEKETKEPQQKKAFMEFEDALFIQEDEAIAKIEDDSNQKINQLMSDSRVQALLKEAPDLSYEELPADIYDAIMAISAEEEKQINAIMDETDTKLKAKAEELGIQEEDEILEERQTEKNKRLEEVKAKTEKPS